MLLAHPDLQPWWQGLPWYKWHSHHLTLQEALPPMPQSKHWVSLDVYWLTPPLSLSWLHLVFNMVKLTLALADLITGRQAPPPPPPELVDSEEEYIVEEVLKSQIFWQKLQYLVKWEGYGVEHNTWEYSDNLQNAADAVNEFHIKNLAAPQHIHALAFGSIPFWTIPPLTYALGWCIPEGGGNCKGNPQLMPTDWPTFKPSWPINHAWHVMPDWSHLTLQLPALRHTPNSNNLSTNSSNNPMGQHTHSTNIFTTQHVSTPNCLLANPPELNLSPRPDRYSKYHGKFTKSSTTSQLQLCLLLLLDTYLPCSLIQYLFIIFTSCHSTFYFYLYILFSSIGSPSFPLWIPC